MSDPTYLTSLEAALELGVRRETIYAYVSRGLIRSEAVGPGQRTRRYSAEDVRRLKSRKAQRRDPQGAIEKALHWGDPILESSLTLIADGRFFYRGEDVLTLAETASPEAVAGLLWSGDLQAPIPALTSPAPSPLSEKVVAGWTAAEALSPIETFQALLPIAAGEDLASFNLEKTAVIKTGARILHLLAAVASGSRTLRGARLAETLAAGWAPENPAAVGLLSRALILCADHELNISSFTARCVASAAANPYAVVLAGLAALQGAKHGGFTARVAAFLQEADNPQGITAALADRLRRGEIIPGFGHRLYPDGDPRAASLLEGIRERLPDAPVLALAEATIEAVEALTGAQPTIDFGLVILARALGLPPGSALAVFAIGRTIGWIGHALEQYQVDQLIRPRARYVGVVPAS